MPNRAALFLHTKKATIVYWLNTMAGLRFIMIRKYFIKFRMQK